MKRVLLYILIIMLCAFMSACKDDALPVSQTDNPNTAQESSVPETEGASLVYMDPELDMFILVPDGNWKYTKELYEGEAYFYPGNEDPRYSVNGFAISSQPKWEEGVEAVWQSCKQNLENLENFTWEQGMDIAVGKYNGYNYHFSAAGMTGDYIIWETESLVYICSLSSDENNYESNYALIIETLGSFKPLGDVKG